MIDVEKARAELNAANKAFPGDDRFKRYLWAAKHGLLLCDAVERLKAALKEIVDVGDCGLGRELEAIACEYSAADRVLKVARKALEAQ